MPQPGSDAHKFLEAVYPEVPDGQAILLWTLPDKRCSWHGTATSAADAALTARETKDVYLGVGLRRAGLDASRRGGSEDVTGLCGLVADFDIAGPDHGKLHLPETREEIDAILADLPFAPSAVIATGGGVHCWWLWRELWALDTPHERAEAMAIAKGWGALIRETARKHERSVDAVHDLARVLRVPGTLNHKRHRRAEVRLEELNGARYNPGDFEIFAAPILTSVAAGLGGLVLDADAQPPFDKFDAMRNNVEKFAQSWERTRKEPTFTSASEYDMSLAAQCVEAGWDDQEIVSLLIASRRKHGDNLKLREDYYARTIRRARSERATGQAVSDLAAQAHADENSDVQEEIDADRREVALRALRGVTGLSVDRIMRYGSSPGEYQITLKSGETVSMGEFKAFRDYETWWERSYEITRSAPDRQPKAAEWKRVLAHIQPLIEEFPSQEAADVAELREQLRGYFVAGRVKDHTDLQTEARYHAIQGGEPFRLEGGAFFQLEKFRAYLRLNYGEKVRRKKLIATFRAAGYKGEDVSVRGGTENKTLTRYYWRVPVAEIE